MLGEDRGASMALEAAVVVGESAVVGSSVLAACSLRIKTCTKSGKLGKGTQGGVESGFVGGGGVIGDISLKNINPGLQHSNDYDAGFSVQQVSAGQPQFDNTIIESCDFL